MRSCIAPDELSADSRFKKLLAKTQL